MIYNGWELNRRTMTLITEISIVNFSRTTRILLLQTNPLLIISGLKSLEGGGGGGGGGGGHCDLG